MIDRKRKASRSRISSWSRSRSRASSWRSSKSSADSRAFSARVREGEALEQLLQEVAVARGRLVERGLLDRAPRLLVRDGAVGPEPEAGEVEQPVGPRVALEQREQLGRRLVGQRARRLAQLLEALGEVGTLADAELELAARGAERLVDAGEHPPEAVRAVRREQAEAVRLAAGAELGERLLERLAPEHRRLRVVELAEARVEAGGERIRLEQAEAEAVDRRDPRAVELAREIVAAAARKLRADARAQLAGRAPRVRDDEDRVDVEALVARRAHEALDEHRRLAGARAGGDEDLARRLDGGELLRVELVHARSTLHIGHRSHHAGQSPPRGSCSTSPVRMRPASLAAVSFALSTAFQNASSSR